jgi:hypothetical protein
LSIHSQTAEQVQELKKQGFRFKELKKLSYKIREIAAAHNIYENFITDIDKQYDDKPGFESEVEKLKSEILKNERDTTFYATTTTFLNSVIIQQQQYIIQLALIKATQIMVRVLLPESTVEILNSAKRSTRRIE